MNETLFHWQPTFSALGEEFTVDCPPTALPSPVWIAQNALFREELRLSENLFNREQTLLAFTGSAVLAGSTPKASVYSGHQFGVWAGQLGDGRAISLGEIQTPLGVQDVQLKGAGPTPFSRRGDGRAVLRSSIREFLCSEAMHGLGIPTTRALCVTGSPATVYREEAETAAVVTRVSPSFLRFGHFEHFASTGNLDALSTLVNHVVESHRPFLVPLNLKGRTLGLLKDVVQRTAALMAQWQAVGFCHGVMNTDNMSILGLTLDYGPFQFLDGFHANHICNHSDSQGRYAFARQPAIAYWNLVCLAQALMPILEDESSVLETLETFKTLYPQEYDQRMRDKLGLLDHQSDDRELVAILLKWMDRERVDYPVFWRRLSHAVAQPTVESFEAVRDLFIQRDDINAWLKSYASRLGTTNRDKISESMLRKNPKYVLRNHLGEMAIQKAKAGDFTMVASLLHVLQKPFDEHPAHEAWAGLAPEWASDIEISCSS